MKTKTLKSERGFSLIELMIVVAIIGILSAIAVPNFQAFQAKARQAEAKSLLSAYFSASKASFAENSFYPGNFVAIGFNPDGALGYHIRAVDGGVVPQFGNSTPGCINSDNGTRTGACTGATAFAVTNWTQPVAAATRGAVPSATAAANAGGASFTTVAGGRIGTTVIDTWTITNTKALDNPLSGLP